MTFNPTPRILFYREGFATNSSSSHSVLLFDKDMSFLKDINPCWGNYNWEDFQLVSKEAKIDYLKSQIASSWNGLHELSGDFGGRNIDHESVWGLFVIPNETGTEPHPVWFQKMADWVSNPNIAIYGGNDNEPSQINPPPDLESFNANIPFPRVWNQKYFLEKYPKGEGYIGKYFETGDYFLVFDKKSGVKMKIKFSNGELPNSSPKPELVDLKITDYCPFDCSYCYQDSTKKGKHASFETIKKIGQVLFNSGVLEVAVGGGEPTLHPNFIDIIKYYDSLGLTVNFTTKNYSILKNPLITNLIKDHVGAFAFSVDSKKDILEIQNLITSLGETISPIHHKICLQHPVGSCSKQELAEMIKQLYEFPFNPIITFLGHKDTGRGPKSLVKASNKDVLEILCHLYAYSDLKRIRTPYRGINIDTTFAKNLEEEIKEVIGADCWNKTMTTKDGKYSAYVDATTETVAPSSYEPERKSYRLSSYSQNEFKHIWDLIRKED